MTTQNNKGMAIIKRHLTTNIDFLLSKSNKWLSRVFEGDGYDIRKVLEEKKANGEILIGSEGCEGFDPVNGCPGHKVKDNTSNIE